MPHRSWPAGHVHLPPLQTWPDEHALPQAPQFAGSLLRPTQQGTCEVSLQIPGGAGGVGAGVEARPRTGISAASEPPASPARTVRRERGAAKLRETLSNHRSDQSTPLISSRENDPYGPGRTLIPPEGSVNGVLVAAGRTAALTFRERRLRLARLGPPLAEVAWCWRYRNIIGSFLADR